MSSSPARYDPELVPALQRIQHEFGYLYRKALEQLSTESGVPRYRLHAVASFFPHFLLSPPKTIRLQVCRDMSCNLAGSGEMLRQLQSIVGKDVEIEGVSCLGRCDRAPAACVAIKGSEHAHYYLGRSAEQLAGIVAACLAEAPPGEDADANQPVSQAEWLIDPYPGETRKYGAVRKAIAARDASLSAAVEALRAKSGWPQERLEQFRVASIRQLYVDFPLEEAVAEAVRCWQQEEDWAKGPELGGWSDALLNELKSADLRGLGGAGIPAIQKWRDVRDAIRTARRRQRDDRGFIVVNGDESEPGTFKDRELLLRTPHLIVEAVILAGLITEASQGFIYIRHEYAEQIEACRAEIERAEKLGVCGADASVLGRPFPVSVFVSPGGYICGEQSALIEAMSDRRGEPRNLPPKLETNGLIDLPTLVSNVETFAWVPCIIMNGGQAYADLGVNGCSGRRFFSVSGDVNRPGVYAVPMGLTLRELIEGEQYCQGISGGRKLKGFAPSGPSGGFLPAKLTAAAGLPRDHVKNKTWQELTARRGIDPAATELDLLDLELELNVFRALSPTQALGAGLVVYAEDRDMAEQAVNSIEFFRNESCGKCVPCRLGSQKLASLGAHLTSGAIGAERWENELVPLIKEMGKAIELASICGLGRSVPVPLTTVINFFRDDLARHLSGPDGTSGQ
ncbi:MAG: formate dehydrogenase beta subunit [Chthoniobacter sp.]|jgi:NADH:ubiquinone oxidoreductase subunit F (NADH-binding)/NADH:ubiquinone oxidoreductase subunit E|nr:formate dehydrogenase beta subunit [Chthoniobacter sp.]